MDVFALRGEMRDIDLWRVSSALDAHNALVRLHAKYKADKYYVLLDLAMEDFEFLLDRLQELYAENNVSMRLI